MDVLHISKSREDSFSSLLKRESFGGAGSPVNSKYKSKKARRERSKTADHAMRLFNLELLKNQYVLLWNSTWNYLQDEKLFE